MQSSVKKFDDVSGAADEPGGIDDGANKFGADALGTSASEELDNWSDIDDIEVYFYFYVFFSLFHY